MEISTRNYSEDRLTVKLAMSHLETLLGTHNGYMLSDPVEKFGWTFFKMAIKPEMQSGIEGRFFDMISRYRRGSQSEKFARFMTDYLKHKGCDAKISAAD